MDTIKNVKLLGKKAKGRQERIRHLEGKPLTRHEAIKAHCFDCTGGYTDGARDCGIKTCSLYRYHPYRTAK